jgi:DNA-binding NarL/FixJ family response regulator
MQHRVSFIGQMDWLMSRTIQRVMQDPGVMTLFIRTHEQVARASWPPGLEMTLVQLPAHDDRGMRAVRHIVERHETLRVIAVTSRASEEVTAELVGLGAWAEINQKARADALIEAIRCVRKGRLVYPPDILDRIVSRGGKMTLAPAAAPAAPALTDLERQLLTLFSEGLSISKVAAALHASPSTVARKRTALMKKIGVSDRTSLVRFAIRIGVIQA